MSILRFPFRRPNPLPGSEIRIEPLEHRIAPAVVLAVSDGAANAAPGDTLTYTIDYSNDGPDDATGVVLTDTLPQGTSFDPALNPTWTAAGSDVTFSVGDLAVGGSGSATLVLTVNAVAPAGVDTLVNSVSASRTDLPDISTATDNTTLDAAPDFNVTKNHGTDTAAPGSTLTYAINFANAGNQDATGVVLTEQLPVGTSFNAAGSSAGWTETTPGVFELTLGPLAGGGTADSRTFSVTVNNTVGAGLDQIANSVAIADDGANGADPTAGDNSATDNEPLDAAPDLTLLKVADVATVAPGGSVTYTFNYANAGNQDAEGAVITDTLPAGTSLDGVANPGWTLNGSTLTFVVGSMSAGSAGTTTLVLAVNGVAPAGLDDIANSATIADDGANGADLTPGDNVATATTTLDAAPELQLTIDDGVATASRSSTLTYTIDYANQGNQDATGVELTDPLPVGTSFDAGLNPGWALNGSDLTFSVGNLASGAIGSATLILTVSQTLAPGQTTIENTATIADDAQNGSDPVPANNTATDTDTIVPAVNLTLTKTDGATNVSPGGTLTYTLSYANDGDINATGVVITDTLPAGTGFDPVANPGWVLNGSTLTFAVGPVAAGGNGTATLILTVNSSIAVGQEDIVNTATIGDDGTGGVDTTLADNSATDTNALDAAPDLTITKTDNATEVRRGETLTYAIGYSNVGNQDAAGVTITDTLPVGTSFDAGANTGWTLNGSTLTFVIGNLAAAGTGTAALVLQVNGAITSGLTSIENTASIGYNDAGGADPTPADNTATDSTTLLASSDLTLTKTDGATNVAPGGTLTYTFTYENVGDLDAAGVVITDTLPTGTSFDPVANPGWVLNGSTLTFAADDVAIGGSDTAMLVLTVVSVAPAGLESIVNTATIDDNDAGIADPTPADNTATDTTTLDAAVDLGITKDDGVETTTPGSTLTYTLSYANTGNQNASGVVITETLPTGTSLNAAMSPGWVLAGNILTFTIGAVAAGGTGQTTLVLTVDANAPAGLENIVNTATIADDGTSGVDATPADNSATDTDTLDAAPDLTLAKTDGQTSAQRGSTLTYTLTHSNVGNQDAAGVTITDTLPVGTSFDAGVNPGWTLNGSTLTFVFGNLAAGATDTTDLILQVNGALTPGLTSIENTATIADDGTGGSDPTPGNNTATDSTTLLPSSDLKLTKTDGATNVAPGGTLTYTFTYENVGDLDAAGVVITDTLPTGTSFDPVANTGWVLSGNTLTFAAGDVAIGGTGTATLVLTVASIAPAGLESIVNTATIDDNDAGVADPTPADNTATDTTTLDAAVDLGITKDDGVETTTPGSTLTYTLNYANTGNQDAAGVVITETLPAGTSFDAASNPDWVLAGNTLTFTIGALAAGGSGSATLILTVDQSVPAGQESIVNTATIADDGTSGTDATPANNSFTDTDTLSATTDLVLTKTDGIATVVPGGIISYVLNYSNVGNQAATGVVITEQLPVGTSFDADASSPGWTETTPGVFEFTVGALAGGGSGSATFVVMVTDPAAAGLANIVNSASVTDDGSNGADSTPADNTATDTNTLTAAPDLVVTKTASSDVLQRGGFVTYSITYSNTGNQHATGVFLTDTLPTNMSFVAAGSTPGWTEQTPGVFRFDVGALGVGESVTVSFQAQVSSTTPLGSVQNSVTIADDTANGADPNPTDNTATETSPVYQGIYAVALGTTRQLPTGGPQVQVFDVGTGALRFDFLAYESTAKGGVRVAVGDLNGDGFDDIVTAYKDGSGRIRAFDGVTGSQITIGGSLELNPFKASADNGAFVAMGDVNGDGRADIIVSEGRDGSRVKVYDGVTGAVLAKFQPFGADFKGGVRVAVGDVNGDGTIDIIAGKRSSGTGTEILDPALVDPATINSLKGGEVRVFTGANLSATQAPARILTVDSGFLNGVFVASADLDGDGNADLVLGGSGPGAPGQVTVFSGANGNSLFNVPVFGAATAFGVRVAVADVNVDGVADIIAGSGPSGTGQVLFFNGSTRTELPTFTQTPFPANSNIGVITAGSVPVS